MPDLLIELDHYGEPPEQVWPRPTPSARRWKAAVLTVVLLLAMGSAGKPRTGVQHLADMAVPAVATVAALDGNLYILEPGALIALDPRTARQRWRVQTDLDREFLRKDGDQLIITGIQVAPTLQRPLLQSMAVDVRTGEVRWHIPGNLTIADGFMVSHEMSLSGIREPGRVEVYDRDGKPIWSLASAARWSSTVDPVRQTVLTLDPATGELVEYRVANGEVLGRVVFADLVGASIATSEQEVFAFFPNGGRMVRGELGFAGAGTPVAEEKRFDCGTLWCVHSIGIKLIDKATGEVVHHGDDWEMAIHTDFGVVGILGRYSSQPKAVSFFDPLSRRIQRLPGWSPVGPAADSPVVRWHGPLYFVADSSPLSFFAVLDGASIRIVGSAPIEHLPQCAATTYLIACRISPQTVRAWHLA